MRGRFILTFENEQEYARWVNILGFPRNIGRNNPGLAPDPHDPDEWVPIPIHTLEVKIPCGAIDKLQWERELENRGH